MTRAFTWLIALPLVACTGGLPGGAVCLQARRAAARAGWRWRPCSRRGCRLLLAALRPGRTRARSTLYARHGDAAAGRPGPAAGGAVAGAGHAGRALFRPVHGRRSRPGEVLRHAAGHDRRDDRPGLRGDLFNLWVWFEAMAISSYLLVAFYRDQPTSLEAGREVPGAERRRIGVGAARHRPGAVRRRARWT